jgi:hypothetical protein
MQPSGLAEADCAKADGRWANAYDGPRDAQEPPDLMAARAAKPAALEFYGTLNSVNRYAILYRIQDTKRPETKAARIAKFTEMLDRVATGVAIRPILPALRRRDLRGQCAAWVAVFRTDWPSSVGPGPPQTSGGAQDDTLTGHEMLALPRGVPQRTDA